jgi:hypothetical protein
MPAFTFIENKSYICPDTLGVPIIKAEIIPFVPVQDNACEGKK